MNKNFAELIEPLDRRLSAMVEMPPILDGNLPKNMPLEGVYLFSEKGRYLYDGRSRNIRNRYRMHRRLSAPDNQASFAFLIARKRFELVREKVEPTTWTRKNLMADETFSELFTEAKKRVSLMEFRFVAEKNDERQALLEIYCSVSLRACYNKFRTH
jgi:hypothetical protein